MVFCEVSIVDEDTVVMSVAASETWIEFGGLIDGTIPAWLVVEMVG